MGLVIGLEFTYAVGALKLTVTVDPVVLKRVRLDGGFGRNTNCWCEVESIALIMLNAISAE
jgi:hypothetical protein